MTNIFATRKFREKNIFFDDQKMRLHFNGKTLGWVKHLHGHDVLEHNNPISENPEDQSDKSEKPTIAPLTSTPIGATEISGGERSIERFHHTENISYRAPEGVKQSKKIRKCKDDTSKIHGVFSTFAPMQQHYEKNQKNQLYENSEQHQKNQKNQYYQKNQGYQKNQKKSSHTDFHRGSKSPKSHYYENFRTRPHAESFRKAMKVQLHAIKSKVFYEKFNKLLRIQSARSWRLDLPV